MSEKLNKDGLIPGQEVDFSTLMRINNKHNEAAKNGNNTKQPKVRRSAKPSVSNVQKAEGQEEA